MRGAQVLSWQKRGDWPRTAYASFAIAAGVNAKALSTYMGHANIGITLDRYGHLMPGNEAEAASLLNFFSDAVN